MAASIYLGCEVSNFSLAVMLRGTVFCQVNNAIGFPSPCVTVHEANE